MYFTVLYFNITQTINIYAMISVPDTGRNVFEQLIWHIQGPYESVLWVGGTTEGRATKNTELTSKAQEYVKLTVQ